MPSLRSRQPQCFMDYTGSVPFLSFTRCDSIISTLSRNYSMPLRVCHCCNTMQLVSEIQQGTDMTCITSPGESMQFLLLKHALWGMLIGKAVLADTSARVGLALPRRCQQQLAKQAPCQLAWPPCLWMVLLSKVAVRTLERAAINTA